MGDQLSPFDDSSIQWETVTKKDGVPYKVGWKKIDCAEEENVVAAKVGKAKAKEDFGIAVNWPVAFEWVKLSPDVADTTGISQYNLWKCDSVLYTYCLHIFNDVHDYHYNYVFYDETGDDYSINTWRNGEHYVQYSSEKPTIVFVKGS